VADQTPKRRAGSSGARTSADRVASILAAAEQTAEQVRLEAEEKLKARVAEGDRAAQYRIDAAEEEASELVAEARAEADRVLREARELDEQVRTTATSEALSIIAKAQQNADDTLAAAAEAASRNRTDAERYSREMITDARSTAEAVKTEGTELVGNLRQLGDSLRSNAERLLRDVQSLHSQMISRIEAVEAARRAHGLPTTRPERTRRRASSEDDEVPDVPEFIPRR
jgi:vacuolar-type H+-ATPase subunit H